MMIGGEYAVISIHALVKRATVLDRLKKEMVKYFNPRPRKEGDAAAIELKKGEAISIHALVKRATFGVMWLIKTVKFQSTPS